MNKSKNVIWMSPKESATNKYNELFSNSVEAQGFKVKNFNKTDFFSVKKDDIIHIHWLHPYYQSKYRLIFLMKSLLLLLALLYMKNKKIKLVWTFHNLYPHNKKYQKLEKWIRKRVLNFCSIITVAGESIKESLSTEFGIKRDKINILHHGHYKGVYPENKVNYRSIYGIEDNKFVFLFVGAIKPYKGVEVLLSEFSKINNEHVHLIIAGKEYDGMSSVLEKYKKIKNITFDLRFIPDDELADIILSSNTIVLPYKNITTSGTAILSASLKRKIICPDTPFMKEYFNNDIAYMYDTSEKHGLLKRMNLAINNKNKVSENVFATFLEKLDWGKIGKELNCLYSKLNN